jgi:hypothetical protein
MEHYPKLVHHNITKHNFEQNHVYFEVIKIVNSDFETRFILGCSGKGKMFFY